MQALILAGGAGTRLRPVLAQLNKPMAPIGGKPFLEYLLLQLKKHQVDEVILCLGYKADLIQSHVGKGDRWGIKVNYSYEPELRGTAGALKLAGDLIHEEDFFVMNGDSLFDIELQALMSYHREMEALATLALTDVDDMQRYGAVGLNEAGRITSFIEKGQGHTRGLINGGVYVFARKLLDFIPAGKPVSLENDILPRLIGQGLYGLPLNGFFIDIGMPADYTRLQSHPVPLLAAIEQGR
ncbi:MAG TPA: nucleotidyltransferase family protein [Ktedonobacteraceae bacterium]|nr:nucleotidyltransferase family protein [Ktedonobacteraceae bacterium]